MARQKKQPKPQPSTAACNVTSRANDFCRLSGWMAEEILSATDAEYSELVEAAEYAVEYLQDVPDAEARLLVELLRDALAKTKPPKDVDEDEEQDERLGEPTAREREAAIDYLVLRLKPEFLQRACVIAREELAEHSSEYHGFFYKLRDLLDYVNFRWSEDYFESNWRELVEEAARRKQTQPDKEKK